MNQRPVGPTWVAAVLTVGAVVAFVLQLVLLLQIGTDWAGAYDVRSGECGWDGTCSDEGSLQVTLWCALVLVAVEIISGLALRSARRLAITIMVGCAVSWLVTFQDSFVYHLAAVRYPDVDAQQGRFFIMRSMRAIAVEVAFGLLVCLAWGIAAWRRKLRRSDRPGVR